MSKLTIENDNGKIGVFVDGEAIGMIQKIKVNCKANKDSYKFNIDILDLSAQTTYQVNSGLIEENKKAIELLSSVPGISLKRVPLHCAKGKKQSKVDHKEYEVNECKE